jgi:hypothetical protein
MANVGTTITGQPIVIVYLMRTSTLARRSRETLKWESTYAYWLFFHFRGIFWFHLPFPNDNDGFAVGGKAK